jgi:hypothetical protein
MTHDHALAVEGVAERPRVAAWGRLLAMILDMERRVILVQRRYIICVSLSLGKVPNSVLAFVESQKGLLGEDHRGRSPECCGYSHGWCGPVRASEEDPRSQPRGAAAHAIKRPAFVKGRAGSAKRKSLDD